jgi:hypothetical protein
MKTFSLLPIFFSIVLCNPAHSQNVLEPCEREYLSSYYSRIDKVVDEKIREPAQLSITTLPSFHPESAVRLVGLNVYSVRFESSLWGDSTFFDERTGRGGHDFSKPQVRTKIRHAPIKHETASRLAAIYGQAIIRAEKSAGPSMRFDGVSYHFSIPHIGCAEAWSPDSGTLSYRLVKLAVLLDKHSTLSNSQALQRNEKKIVKLLNDIDQHRDARPNNSFKPTPYRGVGHVPTLR